MTRSSSRAASLGGSPQAAADNVKIVAAAAASHYQPLDAKYPDQVFLVVDTVIRPLISLCRFWFVPVPRETKVSNATMAVPTLGAASGSAAGRKV